jgi:hypothetical protein
MLPLSEYYVMRKIKKQSFVNGFLSKLCTKYVSFQIVYVGTNFVALYTSALIVIYP